MTNPSAFKIQSSPAMKINSKHKNLSIYSDFFFDHRTRFAKFILGRDARMDLMSQPQIELLSMKRN